jgi:hypothetical protein
VWLELNNIPPIYFLLSHTFFSSIPSQYVSPSSEDGGPQSYQNEGEVVIIVPPLNASLDDDQEQGSPKTTESTSKYRIQYNLLEQAY